jgi:hypothetical protein
MAFGVLARGARIQRFGLIVRRSASTNQADQIPFWPADLENGRKQSSNSAQLKLTPVKIHGSRLGCFVHTTPLVCKLHGPSRPRNRQPANSVQCSKHDV